MSILVLPQIAKLSRKLGAFLQDDGSSCFRVWAPKASSLDLELRKDEQIVLFPMSRETELGEGAAEGNFYIEFDEDLSGARYRFRIDSEVFAVDPASRFQADGVLGFSQFINTRAFNWTDRDWRGISKPLPLIYEIHVGTFTEDGTYDALRHKLPYLASLGIDAIELMPLAEFSGTRNWGYDGVLPYAPSCRYGRPEDLQQLVDEAHALGLGVILDVVYNHFGPEAAPQEQFANYLSKDVSTPWGAGLNFEERGVRNYFIENALYWFEDFHIDGFRFDAIDRIIDSNPRHILSEISQELKLSAKANQRKVLLIAEDAEHSRRCLLPESDGGFGFDLVWNNHFHITAHAFLSGETAWFYGEYGEFDDLVAVLRDGVLPKDGKVFTSKTHDELLESSSSHFVNFAQNHDVVGNRPDGARGSSVYGLPAARLVSGLLLLQASSALLFMGEERASNCPFYYFVDMTDANLRKSISQGRRRDMLAASWERAGVDPSLKSTYEKSIVRFDVEDCEEVEFYRELIATRTILRESSLLEEFALRMSDNARQLIVLSGKRGPISAAAIFNLGDSDLEFSLGKLQLSENLPTRVIFDSLAPTLDGAVISQSALIRVAARSFKVVLTSLN